MEPISVLLLFGAVGCCILYQQLEKNKEQKTFNYDRDTNVIGKTNRQSGQKNYFLVLVVSAKQEKVIQSIKANGKIKADDCWLLYRATQALWMGEESDLLKLNITPDFLKKSKVLDTSEYDVYFLLISLSNYEKGFTQNVTSIDRSDAFEKLPQIATGVNVSDRLFNYDDQLPFLYTR